MGMKADLRKLAKGRESTPEKYTQSVNEVFNETVIKLRKEREKNRRLIAAIRNLTSK